MLMNAWRYLHAAFLTKNVSTFQDLSSVDVKMDLQLAATAAVKYDQKVIIYHVVVVVTVSFVNAVLFTTCSYFQYVFYLMMAAYYAAK